MNNQNQEQDELQEFFENGFFFETPRLLTGYFSKKTFRKFKINQPSLTTLKALTRKYKKIEINELLFDDAPYDELKNLTMEHVGTVSKIIAIAVLGFKSCIPFSVPLFAWYLRNRINQSRLLKISLMIHRLSNYPDLLATFRMMSFNPRTTQPLEK